MRVNFEKEPIGLMKYIVIHLIRESLNNMNARDHNTLHVKIEKYNRLLRNLITMLQKL